MSTEPARRRIAVVVQRFGLEVNGGAELHALMLAQRLARTHEVEVLTSCARDYRDWALDYPAGEGEVAGLRVRRFTHPRRNPDGARARVPLVHKLRFLGRRLWRLLPGPLVLRPRGDADHDGLTFLYRQGPHCVDLLEHLRASGARYDAVLFFAALYEPAALGVLAWGRRSVLVPLLHDEKPMYLPVFHRVFRAAGAILFNTESERRLAARMYGIDGSVGTVAGVGIDIVDPGAEARAAARARHGIDGPYVVYVGRIDVAKGCRDLLRAFGLWARHDPKARLVLVGQPFMTIEPRPGVVTTGFVPEIERNALIAGATALVIPSRYESLSLVTLEAMQLGVPVIANARCEVLDEHIRASGAGWAYRGVRALAAALRRMAALAPPERAALGDRGRAYVAARYSWEHVLDQVQGALERVRALPAATGAAAAGLPVSSLPLRPPAPPS